MNGSGAPDDDVASVCRRHQLLLVERQHSRLGASVFVARVHGEQQGSGSDLVLKRTAPAIGATEIAALRAWSGTGVTPRFIAELEPGLYLAEWVSGPSLATATGGEAVAAVGRALRRLHGTPVPVGLLHTRTEVQVGRAGEWIRLSAVMRALGERIAADLCARHPGPPGVMLHGDLVPANVVLGAEGARLIDPVGRCGLTAWDLAQLVVTLEGRGKRRLLGDLLDGYGGTPTMLAEMLAWMLLFYLDKNLSWPDSPHTTHLQPPADALLVAGDPTLFLARSLL